METETPVWDFSRLTDDFGVLLGHLGGLGFMSSKEVEIQDTANDVIFQRSSVCVVDFDVHTIRIGKEDTMSTGSTVLEIDRVVAVQVGSVRDTVGITTPEGAGVVVGGKSESVSVLTQTVKVSVGGEVSLYTEILRLEDNGVRTGAEEDFLVGVTDDRE